MAKRISRVLVAGATFFATQAAYAASTAAREGVFYTDQARGIYAVASTPAFGLGGASGSNDHSAAMARGLTHDQARDATTIDRAAPHAAANRHSDAMAQGLTHDQAVIATTGVGTALPGR